MLLFLTLLTSGVLAAELPFEDVDERAPYYNDLSFAYQTGLVHGKSATVFAPTDYLTCSEAVKLAACMHIVYTNGTFPAVVEGDLWYQPYVDYCYRKGIITRDYPWDAYITRGEYIELFSRALPSEAFREINQVDDGMIPDVSMDHVYARSIYLLYRAGIINGVEWSYACVPDEHVLRSEIVPILMRMMNPSQRYSFSLIRDPDDFVLMTTPLGNLYYPGRWSGSVFATALTVQKGYAAEIFGVTSSGTAKLYTVYIGTGTENGILVGYVGGTEVRIDVPDLSIGSWNTADKNTVIGMQEDVNALIDQITTMTGFSETLGSSTGEFVLMTTPIGNLYYPDRWSGKVSATTLTVQKGYAAEVFGVTPSGTAKLYTVYIGTDTESGFLVGYVGGTEVRIDVSDLSIGSWSAADKNTAIGMQEDVNALIDQITTMTGFSETLGSSTGEFVLMATPIGNLYYPDRWSGKVSATVLTVQKGYAAQIFGVTPSGTAKLYTVYIGTDTESGFLVGYVGGTEVRIDVPDLSIGSWSAADQTAVIGMQEDVNELIDQITTMTGFSETLGGSSAGEFVLMATPIGNLYYPDRWSGKVSATVLTVQKGYAAQIVGVTPSGTAKLYTVYIDTETEAGFCLGYVNGKEIRIDVPDLSIGSWSAADQAAAVGMQEDVNYIIDQLCSMNGFAFE